jgi:hypothetical protein
MSPPHFCVFDHRATYVILAIFYKDEGMWQDG